MAKIVENFQAISIANGYSFDVDTDRVFDFRAAPVDVTDFSISVYDYDGEAEDEGSLQHSLNITAQIAGIFSSIQDMREKMQDIIIAFALIENESYVDGAEFLGHEKTFEHENNKVGQGTLSFRVIYKTDFWKI